MLQNSYSFKEQPKISPDFQKVLLLREDFENLLKLANAWLEQRVKETEGLRLPVGNSGNIYICNDQRQFITNHYHQNQVRPSVDADQATLPLAETVGLTKAAHQRSSRVFRFAQISPSSPLSFLSSRLSQFTKATRIFTTRDYTHTNVAAEFHQACDNIPNTLVIIKSGQYIAGGYTEVAWETPTQGSVIGAQLSERRYKDSRKAVVFSVNKRKAYRSLQRGGEIGCDKSTGPIFCDGRHDAILVAGNFSLSENRSRIEGDKFDAVGIITGKKELFGNEYFTIDEYEVYKLE